MKFTFFILTISLNANLAYSQVYEEWMARRNQGALRKIALDSARNIYIMGSSNISPYGSDFLIIKYNTNGITEWSQTYNGTADDLDLANGMTIDGKGNVYITGTSESVGSDDDCVTIKYDSKGNLKWLSRYSSLGSFRDAAFAIAIDVDGNTYVTGSSSDGLDDDYVTIKYDSSGIQQWIASYSSAGTSNDVAFGITIDDSNYVYVTGISKGNYATVKYNSSGSQQWVAIYNGPMNGTDGADWITTDNLGNVFVSGSSIGAMGYYDFATVKYSPSGIQQWVRRYEGTSAFMDQTKDMIKDDSGNIYVTGSSTETGQGYNYTTIKYNTNGDRIWLASYHYGLNDFPQSSTIDNNGNLYVTGRSIGSGTNWDFATVKYNSSGQLQWSKRYTSQGDSIDAARDVVVDNNGCIYVTGYTAGKDALTIKYSQITGTTTNLTEIPSGLILFQNYPNPFNPKTSIRYSLNENRFIGLNIYDVLGNKVKVLVNKKQNAGNYEIEFDGKGLPSGIYFYTLWIDGNIIDTKRMILLK